MVSTCQDGVASSVFACPQAGSCFFASIDSDSKWSSVASGQLIPVLIVLQNELDGPGEDASMLAELAAVVGMAWSHSIGEGR